MFTLKLKYFKPGNKNSKVAAANFFKLNQAPHARALQVLLVFKNSNPMHPQPCWLAPAPKIFRLAVDSYISILSHLSTPPFHHQAAEELCQQIGMVDGYGDSDDGFAPG